MVMIWNTQTMVESSGKKSDLWDNIMRLFSMNRDGFNTGLLPQVDGYSHLAPKFDQQKMFANRGMKDANDHPNI